MKNIILIALLLTSPCVFAGGGGAGTDWPWFSCEDKFSIVIYQSHWYKIWRNNKFDEIYYESKTPYTESGDLYRGLNEVIDDTPTATYSFNYSEKTLEITLDGESILCHHISGTSDAF